MVSFTPRLLYPWGKSPKKPIHKTINPSGCSGEEEYLLHLAGTEPRILGRAVCGPVRLLLMIQKEEGTHDVDLLKSC
jgi:hypothetical protein